LTHLLIETTSIGEIFSNVVDGLNEKRILKKYFLTPITKGTIRRRSMTQLNNTLNDRRTPPFTGMEKESDSQTFLEATIRQGARKLLEHAIQEEVAHILDHHQPPMFNEGALSVLDNGYNPDRSILKDTGSSTIYHLRYDDRRLEGGRFTSRILPRCMRSSSSIDALIPALYLNGISTGECSQALSATLGTDASCLSPTVIDRLKETWLEEYDEWKQRDLSSKRYVYLWADGIFFNIRLANDRPSVLVIMGACLNGKKELVGLLDGERENILSWKELLLHLKQHGLNHPPELSVSDGALGFSRALEDVYGKTRQQRCWVHKTADILDTMPRSVHSEAKRQLHDISMAPSKREALDVFDMFLALFEAKYPKACASLKKEKEQLLSFYDFPIDHWKHLRTGNLIDTAFATVRRRRRMTKGNGSQDTTLSMVYKLGREVEKHWRRLNNHELLLRFAGGTGCVDREEQPVQAA